MTEAIPDIVERLAAFPLAPEDLVFRDDEDLLTHLYAMEGVEVRNIGYTREQLELHGLRFGEGVQRVSIIAGCHADEPIGPMTAQILPRIIRSHFPELLEEFRFHLIPQMNPDAALRNAPWFADPPRLAAYLSHVRREAPGEDLEFGFGTGPALKPESRAAQAFLRPYAPYAAHFSLHGMAFAEGAWCLICKEWAPRAAAFMDAFALLCERLGFPLHDVDRKGEKGFTRIREGFSTTPTVEGMRAYFRAQNDRNTARKFMNSSMDWIQGLGGDPLCIVSEVPLFLMGLRSPSLDDPVSARLKEDLEKVLVSGKALEDATLAPLLDTYALSPTPIALQVRLQAAMVILSLVEIMDSAEET